MRVLLAGATGVLGRRLVRGFRARGHEVLGLARSPANGAAIRELGGQPARKGSLGEEGILLLRTCAL